LLHGRRAAAARRTAACKREQCHVCSRRRRQNADFVDRYQKADKIPAKTETFTEQCLVNLVIDSVHERA